MPTSAQLMHHEDPKLQGRMIAPSDYLQFCTHREELPLCRPGYASFSISSAINYFAV